MTKELGLMNTYQKEEEGNRGSKSTCKEQKEREREAAEMRWNGNVQTMTQRRSSKKKKKRESHRIVTKRTKNKKEAKISIEK